MQRGLILIMEPYWTCMTRISNGAVLRRHNWKVLRNKAKIKGE